MPIELLETDGQVVDLTADSRDSTALLHRLFERTASEFPDHIAVSFQGGEWTYSELERTSNQLAHWLRKQGVSKGHYVGLLLPRSPDVYVALLAVLKTGAAYVPIDPDYPADRVGYILENCQAHILITTSERAERQLGFRGKILALDVIKPELDAMSSANIAEISDISPDDVCYVIYTSGSTGRPKGVQIQHRSVCHLVQSEGEIFGVTSEDRVFQGFSIAFDASVEEIWLAFFSGATLVVGTREMMQAGPALAKHLTDAGVTVFSTVPTLLALFEDELSTVRLLILGGEACPQDLIKRWWKPGRRLVNSYGPTETTVIATFEECHPDRPVTIGKPAPGYYVHLLDDQMKPVLAGATGEIYIGGPGVALGYLGLPDLTREKFVVNPFADDHEAWPRLYRSGDLGRYNASGAIEFMGRADLQVKLRGFRIELSEIESELLRCAGVLSCAVTLREDEPGLPQLVAFVVPRTNEQIDVKTIRSALRERLPAYMVPGQFEAMATLPSLPSGKIDRMALSTLARPRETQNSVCRTDFESTSIGHSHLERVLLSAWARLFSPLSVTIEDNFFSDLGGHSLLAARLVSQLRSDPMLKLESLSVIDLYDAPTIKGLASRLERAGERRSGDENARDKTETRPEIAPSAKFQEPNRGAFTLCGIAQLFGLYFILGFFSLQWLAPYLMYTWMIDQDSAILEAIVASLGVLLAVYPAMLAASIAIKWLVIGLFKQGEYPLWGITYFRWWFVHSIQSVVPVSFMAGTPLICWYYRLMGAKIGANVHIGTASLLVFDLASIDDDTCIGSETDMPGYTVEDGRLKIGSIKIGRGCFVGNRAVIREQTEIGDDAKLDDLSLLTRGARIPVGKHWAGTPARPIEDTFERVAERAAQRPSAIKRLGFGALHGLGMLVFPLMVIGAFFPGLVVMNELNYQDEYYWYLLLSPLVAVSFVIFLCLEIALIKWILLGRVQPGRYDIHSSFYVRKWFIDQLLELSLDVIGPLYATMYLNPWYCLLGAKLGRHAEISTASFISPDLLTIGEGGFVADAVSLGAARVEKGRLTVAPVEIGRRAFIGNSALLPPGASIGENSLIGVLSIPPRTSPGASAPSQSWLGSPALFLPQRQESTEFESEFTFNPSRKLIAQRLGIEFMRIILPSSCFIVLTCLLLSVFLLLHDQIPFFVLLAIFPLIYACFGVVASLFVVMTKWLLMGAYRPSEYPLWSTFVWRTELVTALYENLARLFLVDMLQGTPYLAMYLRLLGAKVGKRVFLNTAEFTEFDLTHIGDDAALNEEATIQSHLFEDRVMKMSTVRIGRKCSVGSQAVVLYDTEMGEGSTLDNLSLLMKGETLPPWTRWEGSPARAKANSAIG